MSAAHLGDVCEVVMGQAPPGDSYNGDGRGFPLVAGAGDMKAGRVAPTKFTTAPTKLSRPDDVIIGIRASIGMRAESSEAVCLGRGVAALRPRPGLDRGYLWHWVEASASRLAAKGRGATFLQVSRQDIEAMEILVPPLDEQRRIVRALDTVAVLVAAQKHAVPLMMSLAEARYADMYGPVGDPRWDRVTLADVATVTTGSTPPRASPEHFGDAIEWVKNGDVQTDWPYVEKASEGLSSSGAARARVATAGSVLVTCISGSPTAIGRAAMVDRDVAFNQQINAVTPLGLDPSLLYMQLRLARRRIRHLSTGGMKGMISKRALQSLEISRPPVAAQSAFRELFSQIVASAQVVRERALVLDELFASMQDRAFTGAL